MPEAPSPIYICGATATGKTSHALHLASELNGEIVNADAFQLFHGIETITAAPSAGEKSHCPHHLFGILQPGEKCDAGRYSEIALPVIAEIQSRNKTPIIVGGSGLYLKFLTHGASPLPKGDPAMREEMDARPLEDLLAELETLDPTEAAQVSRTNRRFVSRSLEICLLTGQKVSELRDGWEKKTHEKEKSLLGHWLIRTRPELHARIAQRTDQMLAQGAIQEVEKHQHIPGTWQKAIGVPEIRQLLAGEISPEKCAELITFATRQYAKRQETWFKREKWLKRVEL
ncbi:MAG: tRNA (adenosine(37)-N6)-dimethylallyltransferase MiaA [Luteolibacter sp.]